MSMSRVRIVVAVFVVVCAFSVAMSSSALAGMGWFVSGIRQRTSETAALTNTARVTEGTVLNVPSLGVKLTCAALSGERAEISGTTLGKAKHLFFENCSMIEPAACALSSKNITTAPILALPELSGSPTKLLLLFHPETGKEFANVEFVKNPAQSKACASFLVGQKPILVGAFNLLAPTGLRENTEQELEDLGTTDNNSLEISGDKEYLESGKAFLKLVSGAEWSFAE
jgi:hypothetical protein